MIADGGGPMGESESRVWLLATYLVSLRKRRKQPETMPLYEYQCKECGRRTEKIQKFSDAELTVCPHCQGTLERTITAPAVHFAGGGWYKDLYSSAKPAAPSGEGKSETPAAAASTDASKPATPAASSTPAATAPAAAPSSTPATSGSKN